MNDWKKIDLCGVYLLVCQAHSNYLTSLKPPTTYSEVQEIDVGEVVVGHVQGNFELDLQAAGIIEEPFFGDNILSLQKMEDRHLFYAKKFNYEPQTDLQPWLVFEGIDTIAQIFLNGELVGECENMLIPQQFSVSQLLAKGENELVVHIFPSCIAARKNKVSVGNAAFKYNYETLRLRKAPHMFGWDIMPRLVSGGIFRPAYLEFRPSTSFKQAYLFTSKVDTIKNEADLQFFYEIQTEDSDLSNYNIEVYGSCKDSTFFLSERLWFTAGRVFLNVKNIYPWWPKGYGQPNLYDVTISLKKCGTIVDTYQLRTGIRTVKLHRTGVTDNTFSGKFQFEVNEKKVFIMGTNFVPIDAFHSRDRERLPTAMDLLEDIGCNAVRCWGGGIYEDEYFYNRCDEGGILIWQDFVMACAIYPTDTEFCKVLREEAEITVRRLRQHPSILVWAGDNECDQAIHCWGTAFPRDPNRNHITRQVLQDVIDFEDPTRPYLPSSPFIDEDAKSLEGDSLLTEQHLWGPRDYYKSEFYKGSVCNFVSEIGYHGCPSRISLEKFLPKAQLWPWQNNDMWVVHASSPEKGERALYAYRIELMAKQIKKLFGTIPENLDDFILASQISQAEANKFFIELFRSGQPQRTGIIWWNLLDGWPQFSDAVVDYYYEKKLAYHYIKQVQQPILLTIAEPLKSTSEVKLVNDTGECKDVCCRISDYMDNRKVIYENCVSVDSGVTAITSLPYFQDEQKIYILEWEYDKKKGRNHYLSGNPPFGLDYYREFLQSFYKK